MKYKDLPECYKDQAAQLIVEHLDNHDMMMCAENGVEYSGCLYTPDCADVAEYLDRVDFYMRRSVISGIAGLIWCDDEVPEDTRFFVYYDPIDIEKYIARHKRRGSA